MINITKFYIALYGNEISAKIILNKDFNYIKSERKVFYKNKNSKLYKTLYIDDFSTKII